MRVPGSRLVRRLAVGVIGGTVVSLGVAMVVLPGPAVVVIPVGLAILATEFLWARRLLRNLKERSGSLLRTRDDHPGPRGTP
jgi:tellurite resistance protein TerC